ncbi:hypothetical protein GH714_033068 [Hevea brasiliensis]|uniref:Uncharacterized protein n=1 Tax=Hevea brasiliensis TaxID=3981 RepID=A0A6A6KA05_HEVBR|nr:hypothetical protein GH714_033068 [Hevea brasiliensis]
MYTAASASASALLRASRARLSSSLSSSITRASAHASSSPPKVSPSSLVNTTQCRSLSFSAAVWPSVPSWSHGVRWQSPVSLRPQIRAVAPVTERFQRKIATMGGGDFGKFYSLPALNDPRIDKLPYSVRILLESAIRNCDKFQVTKEDAEKIIDWENTSPKLVEIPFKPACVLLEDFTGVPAVVDLASMRDAMSNLGGDSNKINPLVSIV